METSTPYDRTRPISSQALIISIATQFVAAQLAAKTGLHDEAIIAKALHLTELLLNQINEGFSEPTTSNRPSER
jgi:hypothetical protein